MAEQVPSVGRVVHYVAFGGFADPIGAGPHRAAIITEVKPNIGDGRVSLCILNPSGMSFAEDIAYHAAGNAPATWHWPEFVPPKA